MKYNNIKNKIVLLRLDLNVPIENSKIIDDYKIVSCYETIDILIKNKNKIIIISHLGEKGESLEPVYRYLNKRYKDLTFIKSTDQKEIKNQISNELDLENKKSKSSLIMLENLRCFEGEKKNSATFANT